MFLRIDKIERDLSEIRKVHYHFSKIRQERCDMSLGNCEIEAFLKGMNIAEKLYAMTVLDEKSEVTNLKGERVIRDITLSISRVTQFPNGENVFETCCNALAYELAKILFDKPIFMSDCNYIIFPSIAFVLGGASRMAPLINEAIANHCDVGKKSNKKMPWFRLARQITDGVMTGFGFSISDRNHGIDLGSGNAYAVLIDDSGFTLRSQKLALDFLEGIGVKVIASLVFFDQYKGEEWPEELDGIPIKIALAPIR